MSAEKTQKVLKKLTKVSTVLFESLWKIILVIS